MEEYRPDLTDRRLDVIPAPNGMYYETNFVPGSGITLDWFINTFVRKDGEKLSKAFERIDEEAGKIRPGCDDVMAIGLLSGSSMPLISSLRGMWMGFDWSHKQGHFYRALLESFSYDFALTEKRIEALYPEYDLNTVKIIGGGAKSPLWTQMNADVMGKEFHRLNREDVAMWGAAMLAGSAIGLFPDITETAKQHVKVEKKYLPDMKMNEIYKKHMELYKEYTVELTDFFERIQKLGKQ
ncbi:Xylulose kinase [bioreactor metagenome]|uniref:Xylulose kinase n=1 Tax=bioreactor metagenome TaxID=1076179 RepID=A0A645F3E3_9ZZZZ